MLENCILEFSRRSLTLLYVFLNYVSTRAFQVVLVETSEQHNVAFAFFFSWQTTKLRHSQHLVRSKRQSADRGAILWCNMIRQNQHKYRIMTTAVQCHRLYRHVKRRNSSSVITCTVFEGFIIHNIVSLIYICFCFCCQSTERV